MKSQALMTNDQQKFKILNDQKCFGIWVLVIGA